MMKLSVIHLEKDAANFLLNKVGDPHITWYIYHVSATPNARKVPHTIVPDIHAQNFPVGRQSINDSSSASSAEAIFEVKSTLPANPATNITTQGSSQQIVGLEN